jgi:hypothetical protein
MVNFTTTGTFSGYYTAELSDANGSFASPVIIGAGSVSPISAVIPASTPSGTGYRIRVANTNPLLQGTDNGTDLAINTCISNTITTSVISGNPFCPNTSYNLQVPFTSTGTFTGTFTAELSDASGSFSNPLVIGNGTGNPIAATIPSGTAPGYNYRIRVLNSSPAITGADNGADLQINTCLAINTEALSGSPYCANTSYVVNVPFNIVGSLTGPFIAELSDISGSFLYPTAIGYGNSSPVFATIPSSMTSGNAYRIRIRDYSSGISGSDNGTNISINTCLTTGVWSSEESQLCLYPNPNEGSFNINPSFSGDANVSVMNVLGETIFQYSIKATINEPFEIKLNSDVQKGAYIIKVQSGDKTYQKAMMIF